MTLFTEPAMFLSYRRALAALDALATLNLLPP
jgi:hypothetical protein